MEYCLQWTSSKILQICNNCYLVEPIVSRTPLRYNMLLHDSRHSQSFYINFNNWATLNAKPTDPLDTRCSFSRELNRRISFKATQADWMSTSTSHPTTPPLSQLTQGGGRKAAGKKSHISLAVHTEAACILSHAHGRLFWVTHKSTRLQKRRRRQPLDFRLHLVAEQRGLPRSLLCVDASGACCGEGRKSA